MRYLDAHCHLQFDAYDADREAVIARMREEGVGGVVVGVDFDSSHKAVALALQLAHIAAHLESAMPATAAAILAAVHANKKPANLFPRLAS